MVYYTVPEVAKMLRVSRSYVYDMIIQGKMKSVRLSERRIRIPAGAVEEFTKEKMDNQSKLIYNAGVVQPSKRRRK